MGEAKRRKQKLGSEYGQPLGLNALKRRILIEENLPELLSAHYQACGYPDFAKSPHHPEFGTASETNSSFDFMPSLIRHWQETFNSQSQGSNRTKKLGSSGIPVVNTTDSVQVRLNLSYPLMSSVSR